MYMYVYMYKCMYVYMYYLFGFPWWLCGQESAMQIQETQVNTWLASTFWLLISTLLTDLMKADEIGTIIIPTLQMRNLTHGEAKQFPKL